MLDKTQKGKPNRFVLIYDEPHIINQFKQVLAVKQILNSLGMLFVPVLNSMLPLEELKAHGDPNAVKTSSKIYCSKRIRVEASHG